MKRHQDIIDPPITVGEYMEIVAPVYTDNTDTTLDTNIESYVIEWRLLGTDGALITKSTADGGNIRNVTLLNRFYQLVQEYVSLNERGLGRRSASLP